MVEQVRTWRPGWPCAVGPTLRILRRGAGDPTYRTVDGALWRGIRTPDGPAALRIVEHPDRGEVEGTAWGPGAPWVLESLPAMLGAEDDVSGFEPRHPVLVEAHRRHPHWRVTRTGLVMEALVPAVLEQKVTGKEAFAGFRALVYRFGERAPGPGGELGVWVQPAPTDLRLIPSWDWLRMGVDPAHSRRLLTVAARAGALERGGVLGPEELDRRLRSLPGIGVWTSAEVRFRALGDADAVSFSDYHVGKNITWALTGEIDGDDDRLAALLEPWRPHRHRVQRLIELAGLSRPRRGPRMTLPTHLPADRWAQPGMHRPR